MAKGLRQKAIKRAVSIVLAATSETLEKHEDRRPSAQTLLLCSLVFLHHNLWSICDVRIWARDSSSQSSHRGCYLWMQADFGSFLSIFMLILEVFWAISCWFWSFFGSIFMLIFLGANLRWFWKVLWAISGAKREREEVPRKQDQQQQEEEEDEEATNNTYLRVGVLEVTKTILSLLNSKLCVDRANYVPPDFWKRLLKNFCVCVWWEEEPSNRRIGHLESFE